MSPSGWRARWQAMTGAQRDRALGLFFILIVALIWVLASFLVQEVEKEGLNPFLLTYIANSLFVVYIPLYYGITKFQRWKHRVPHSPGEEDEGLVEANTDRFADVPSVPFRSKTRQILGASLVVAPLWFAAQWTFNLSLSWTTVMSNTILSSTSSLFTYGMAVLLLNEGFTVGKLASVLCCILGTIMVTLADEANSEGTSSVFGDLLVLLSAIFYASYTIAIRSLLKEDEGTKMMLFFGFIGCLNLVALFPVMFVLVETSFVSLANVTTRIFMIAVAKGLFDNVLSDYLWARAVLLIGPTVATVGLSMQVPIATVADMLLKRPDWLSSTGSTVLMLLGATAVLLGFFGVNLGSNGADATSQAAANKPRRHLEAMGSPRRTPAAAV